MQAPTYDTRLDGSAESSVSGVSWAAVIAGAFTAAAVSLILMILGSGIGLATMSPWIHSDDPATTFTVGAVIWVIIMQWVSSGLGGYLTGRLRTKWAALHADEVFFRDTAHGFLSWAVATIVTAAFLATTAAAAVGLGAATTAAVKDEHRPPPPPVGREMGHPLDPTDYYVDMMFRSPTGTSAVTPDTRAEAKRILVTGAVNGDVSPGDRSYLATLVQNRSGLPAADAAKRVDNVIAQGKSDADKAKQKADEARKVAAHVSLYMFLSLLLGAFLSSVAAALGGRHRDLV